MIAYGKNASIPLDKSAILDNIRLFWSNRSEFFLIARRGGRIAFMSVKKIHLKSGAPAQAAASLLKGLNEKQHEAVITTDGPVLILAGAGSGKTKTLTHRIAYTVREKGVSPENILALTFTNKAAKEMKERVIKLIGGRNAAPWTGTFHGFCSRFLREQGESAGIGKNYNIYDTAEAESLMKSVIVDMHLSPKEVPANNVLSRIGKWKDDLITPEEALALADGIWEKRAAQMWQLYDKRMKETQSLDFDSLLYETALLLKRNEPLREALEKRFRYLSVDEYQDTNMSQFALVKMIAGGTRNICAVGDDAQSIYGWRGARVENIRKFPDHFAGCKVITLDQNYRSTQAILDSANLVISQSAEAIPKKLWTENGAGETPMLIRSDNEKEEGKKVLREFKRLFENYQYRPSDAAILYRTNAQSRAIEESCLYMGIPYEIVGGLTFYERKEVKDILAYLKFINNPKDEMSFRRMANVPPRGVGDRSVEVCMKNARALGKEPLDPEAIAILPDKQRQGLTQLSGVIGDLKKAAETLPPGNIIEMLLDRIGFRDHLKEESERKHGRSDLGEERFLNVLEILSVAKRHEKLGSFLEEIALISDVEKSSSKDENRQRVRLTTIHAAKGLEFPVVAVVGMEEGLMPHQNSMESQAQLEEERRLCYVALTRAKERLFLSYARARTIYGQATETIPSRFLEDIGKYGGSAADDSPMAEGIVGTFSEEEEAIDAEAIELPFQKGDRVSHALFGEGTVEAISGNYLVVRFGASVKTLDPSYATLNKIG